MTADGTVVELLVELDGAGNVAWYVNGVQKGASALGPTGESTSAALVQLEVANGADAASQRLIIPQVTYAIAQ